MNNILYCGSFYNDAGDIVDEILKALKKINSPSEVIHYDPEIYNIKNNNKILNLIYAVKIQSIIENYNIKTIIFCAGGLIPADCLISYAKKRKIKLVSFQLSDPDDYTLRGSKIAPKVDLITTNSSVCLSKYSNLTKVSHLKFGCTNNNLSINVDEIPKYDICIVGEARPERVRLAAELVNAGLSINIYGRYWSRLRHPFLGRHLPISNFIPKKVQGDDKYKEINKSLVYLSFCRTLAGYSNIKVGFYEALSCGAFIALDASDDEINTEFDCSPPILFNYKNSSQLIEKVIEIKNNGFESLASIRKCNLDYFKNKCTWEARLAPILREIDEY